jgi:hypothetical protein
MKNLILASAAAVLLTGSLANAQFLLGSDENDNKQVTNLSAGQMESGQRHAARIVTGTSGAPSGAFLLGSDENGNKQVVNTYAAPRRSAARIAGDGASMSTTSAGRVSPGFLIHGGAHKTVENQYAR